MMANNTILITGALGQVGKRCTELLLERNDTVVALDIDNPANHKTARQLQRAYSADKLHLTYVDLTDSAAVVAALRRYQPAVIIHLAAVVSPVCYANPTMARRVNVDGTRYLVDAAKALERPPLFVFASSSAVYGSRNPYSQALIDQSTPVKPVECYGIDKVAGETIVAESGLPYALLRLAGILSPDGLGKMSPEYMALVRATPGDNRVHGIDARDVALAFANAAGLPRAQCNRVFLIAGDDSYRKTQREIEDDVMAVLGVGRLGPTVSLPGDPNDELGWSFTDWFDVGDSQTVLQFQQHSWAETLAWLRGSMNPLARVGIKLIAPCLRWGMKRSIERTRKREQRGEYANPWALIGQLYGDSVLTPEFSRQSTSTQRS